MARTPEILKAAATVQKPTETKAKVVKLLSISSVIQLLKQIDLQDSRACVSFLDWCIGVERKTLRPDIEVVDLISVSNAVFFVLFACYTVFLYGFILV